MNDIRDIKNLINAGMYLQTLTVLIEFAIKNNKESIIEKIKELEEEFINSLSEQEKVEYKNILQNLYNQKAEEFMGQLKNVLTPEEIQEIVPQMTQG